MAKKSKKNPKHRKYNKWSTQDLMTAFKARSGRDLLLDQDHVFYIEKLLELDRSPPGVFRFMDLPAEMRNNIYEELLAKRNRTNSLVTYPAILRTCMAINKEATSILYVESSINLEILYDYDTESTMLISTRGDLPELSIGADWKTVKTLLTERLARFENINIDIDYSYRMRTDKRSSKDLIKFLRAIPTIFKHLRKLKVDVQDSRKDTTKGQEQVLQLLAPLKKLLKEGKAVVAEGLDNDTRNQILQ